LAQAPVMELVGEATPQCTPRENAVVEITPPSTPRKKPLRPRAYTSPGAVAFRGPGTRGPRAPNSVALRRQLQLELEEALDDGSWGEVSAILSRDGSSPLHRAVVMAHPRAVDALLERADPNLCTARGTPLQVCTELITSHFKAEQRLVSLAAHPALSSLVLPTLGAPQVETYGRAGAEDLQAVARALLAAGADPDLGEPLGTAAQSPSPALGLLLLQHGADPNRRGADGKTPLWHAARMCPLLVAPLLEQGANPLADVGRAEGDLLLDCVTDGAAKAALRRATRWWEVRMFVWAYAREVVSGTTGLADLPGGVCDTVISFMARV